MASHEVGTCAMNGVKPTVRVEEEDSVPTSTPNAATACSKVTIVGDDAHATQDTIVGEAPRRECMDDDAPNTKEPVLACKEEPKGPPSKPDENFVSNVSRNDGNRATTSTKVEDDIEGKLRTSDQGASLNGPTSNITSHEAQPKRRRIDVTSPKAKVSRYFSVEPRKSLRTKKDEDSRTPPTIIVIGAGFAGLAAAQDLTALGYKVTVLEGRDRVGGRAWTDKSLGPVDLGAAWIHGIQGNPLAEMIKAKGIETVHVPEKTLIYDSNGRLISNVEDTQMEDFFNRVLKASRDALLPKDEDMSLGHSLKIHTLKTPIRALRQSVSKPRSSKSELVPRQQRLFDWHTANIEYSVATDVDNLSLRYGLDIDGLEHGFEGDHVFLKEGYSGVTEALAEGLEVHLKTPVVRVQHGEEKVQVRANDGRVFAADAVIITLPLGVLKRGHVTFDPPLPEYKQGAIKNLGFGTLNKVVLSFSDSFWDKAGTKYIGHAGEKGRYYLFIDVSEIAGKPTLLSLLSGNFALEMEAKEDYKVVAEGMQVLRKIFPEGCPEAPTAYTVTRWGTDIFSMGSYSYMPVGGTEKDISALAEPVGSQLFFAGEATCADCPSSAHGAYVSGRRVSCQVVAHLSGRPTEAAKLLAQLVAEQKAAFPAALNYAEYSNLPCQVCHSTQDEENMLLCDLCNKGYHMQCLSPAVKEIPLTAWYCPKCIARFISANEIAQHAAQVLSRNALAGITGDPEMGLEHMSKDAIKVTFKCTVCGQEGKGKVDLVRHYASRGHKDAVKSLLAAN
uniref:PHD-type domain-containing protein n=1 Tax=Eutreptiella gymnastica TaxID=73025 RepID=A0A7S1J4X5_9EUGL|mmetsp:Transcript_66312/g.117776  ORF Transcript_66312/g.117776 Transcript_66312/m.117776 type:complete len:784 (+) Transcript_66312:91-2442(+)